VYIRFGREATPAVMTEHTPLVFGKANVIRYRGGRGSFADSFQPILAADYPDENEGLSLIACGAMVPEAMRAALLLKQEDNVETRVINLHTIKPLDREAVVRAARETRALTICEEHQIGGLGGIVARSVCLDGGKP
jgi:transketolase